jgi:hypothetical protein
LEVNAEGQLRYHLEQHVEWEYDFYHDGWQTAPTDLFSVPFDVVNTSFQVPQHDNTAYVIANPLTLATKSCFFAVWSTFNTMMELQVLDPGEFT